MLFHIISQSHLFFNYNRSFYFGMCYNNKEGKEESIMALDGLIIHYLIDELNEQLLGGRINKIIQPNQSDIVLQVRQKQNAQLLLSLAYTAPRLYLTKAKISAPPNPYQFCMMLRKYLERGLIKKITQISNDRIIDFDIEAYNEMGDLVIYHLICEITGRSSNLILTNEDYIIIDLLRKHFPSNAATSRIMIPKAKYQIPTRSDLVNPFEIIDCVNLTNIQLEGISKYHLREINYLGSLKAFLSQPLTPSVTKLDNKKYASPFILHSVEGEVTTYPSLSEMLEAFYYEEAKLNNPEYSMLAKAIRQKNSLLEAKLTNLDEDLTSAKEHLIDLEKGQLIQAHLYEIKKGMSFITVPSFDGESEVTIELDPLKSATDNMQKYFKQYKKSQNALLHIDNQISKANNEISYLQTVLVQLDFANQQELAEIKHELQEYGFLKKTNKKPIKNNSLKNITTYQISGAKFYVGKNNLQNNYLTHKLAKREDYWFHVQNAPSSHVIVALSGPLNERIIRIAAMLAAMGSHFESSSSVPVDYTMVKHIKKVPNTPGCFVTYTNQKTIYIDPSSEKLQALLKEPQ